MDKSRLAALHEEQSKRYREIHQVYRPFETTEGIHRCPAPELLVRGGKRAGKSVSVSTTFSARVTGQPIFARNGEEIPNPWPVATPDYPRRYWVIGWDTKHIGQTIYRLLFEPGQGGTFRVIQDAKTGIWVPYNRAIANHRKRVKESRLSEPLIPERFLRGGYDNAFDWEEKKSKQFNCCRLVNGAEIYAFPSSARNPKQGDAVSGIWVDEDIQFPHHLKEWQDRLTDEEGWFIWSVWPHLKNEALINLIDRAEVDELDDDPLVVSFSLSMTDNPYLSDKGKRASLGRMNNEEEVARRNRGELLTDALSMYQMTNEVHLIRRPLAGRKRLRDLTPVHKYLEDMWVHSGRFPKTWTRYFSVDPSHSRTAGHSWVVPPPEWEGIQFGLMAICEWEIVARRFTAEMFSKAVADLMGSDRYEAYIMDMRAGRQTHAGREDNTHMLFSSAFRDQKLMSRQTSYSFLEGCPVPATRFAAVRNLMMNQEGTGCPRLLFVEERCQETIQEFAKYRKKSEARGDSIDSVLDVPRNPRLFDCMQSMEYFAAFIEPMFLAGQGYVEPDRNGARGSSAYQAALRIKKKQGERSQSVYLGPGDDVDSGGALDFVY